MKKILLMNFAIAIAFLFLINTTACNSAKKTSTATKTQTINKEIVIATSAQCGSCKTRIETALTKLKGVKSATLNLKNKNVTVAYDANTVTPEAIKTAITNIGYDADAQSANPSAYQKLPACCQKGGHD